LPIFEIDEADEVAENSRLAIDMDNGEIINLENGKVYKFKPIPEFMQKLVKSGGLMNYAREKIGGSFGKQAI